MDYKATCTIGANIAHASFVGQIADSKPLKPRQKLCGLDCKSGWQLKHSKELFSSKVWHCEDNNNWAKYPVDTNECVYANEAAEMKLGVPFVHCENFNFSDKSCIVTKDAKSTESFENLGLKKAQPGIFDNVLNYFNLKAREEDGWYVMGLDPNFLEETDDFHRKVFEGFEKFEKLNGKKTFLLDLLHAETGVVDDELKDKLDYWVVSDNHKGNYFVYYNQDWRDILEIVSKGEYTSDEIVKKDKDLYWKLRKGLKGVRIDFDPDYLLKNSQKED